MNYHLLTQESYKILRDRIQQMVWPTGFSVFRKRQYTIPSPKMRERLEEALDTISKLATQKTPVDLWKSLLLCKVQGARCKVQGARCKVQGARCKVQGARCKVQGAVNVPRGYQGLTADVTSGLCGLGGNAKNTLLDLASL